MGVTKRQTRHGIDFEWDASKAAANQRKHGVDAETACEVFFDPFVRVEDATGEGREVRDAAFGLTLGWLLLKVVYLERGEVIRIISARPAEPVERRAYEDP